MHGWRSALATCLALASGCGDSHAPSSSPDGGGPDAASGWVDGGPDARVDVGQDGSLPSSGLDAADDAANGSGGPDSALSDTGTPPHDAGPRTINGYLVADHCSPGDYNPAFLPDCEDVPNGEASAEAAGTALPAYKRLVQWWNKLDKPMIAGQPYAMSIEAEPDATNPAGSLQMEIWGTMSPCASGGEGAERLAVDTLGRSQVYCHDVHPTRAWTHVIVVFRVFDDTVGITLHGQTYCQTGTCPH